MNILFYLFILVVVLVLLFLVPNIYKFSEQSLLEPPPQLPISLTPESMIFEFENQILDYNYFEYRVSPLFNYNEITVILISKKINYVCDGLDGIKNIDILEKSNTIIRKYFPKNEDCFPNGVLKPEYIMVVPKVLPSDTYFVSSNTPLFESALEYFEYFNTTDNSIILNGK